MNPQNRTTQNKTTATIDAQNTVVITYNPDKDVFSSQVEGLCLSASFLLNKLHWRASQHRVQRTLLGDLTITVPIFVEGRWSQLCCRITEQAVESLRLFYQQDEQHQSAYPLCRQFF